MNDTNKKMQVDEYSGAISFANGYFALVDGHAYGLEDYLVEDVRLEWFGRVIKGRKNVAAFMKNHMANSSHMFAEIMPIANIDTGICQLPRRKYKSEGNSADTVGNITEDIVDSDLSFESLRIEDEATNEKDETTPSRSEVAMKNLEMEQDYFPDKYASVHDKSLIKFVESKGIVQFDRRFMPHSIRKRAPAGFNSGETAHQWRRRCILKMAYSTRFQLATKSEENLTNVNIFGAENNAPVPMDCGQNKRRASYASRRRKRLKSFDDILSYRVDLKPIESFDCLSDVKRFIECFKPELSAADSKSDLTTPKCVGNRLDLDATEKINPECREYSKCFKFDYMIHTIVYESNIECKLNLFEEFEKQEIVEPGETKMRV